MNHKDIKLQMQGLRGKYINFLVEFNEKKTTKLSLSYNKLKLYNKMHELYQQVMQESKLMDATFQDCYADISI